MTPHEGPIVKKQANLIEAILSSSLASRVVAGLVMSGIALFCLWMGGRLFSSMVAFLAIMMVFEWTRLVDGAEFTIGYYVLSVTSIIAIVLAASGYHAQAMGVVFAGGLLGAGAEMYKGRSAHWAFVGAFYIITPCVGLIWIRAFPDQGRALIAMLFAGVWMTDIGAFFVGRTLGGPAMAPTISPNKTWSGTLGGILIGGLSVMVVGLVAKIEGLSWWGLLATGLGLAIATVLGDLAESWLKRRYGVKDSGGYIPGHGGVLDRLDGMIFAAIVMSAVLYVGQVM